MKPLYTLEQAREKFTTIPAVMRAYNIYEIDDKTKNTLLKEIKERGKKITERTFGK